MISAVYAAAGQCRRWRQAMENSGVVRRLEQSERHGHQGLPAAQHGLCERQPWNCWDDGALIDGREVSAHPYLARQMSDLGFRQNH